MGRKNHKHHVQSDRKVDYKLLNHWSKIESELASAFVVLMQDAPNKELEDKYEDYIRHNEFELAYQTLKELGKDQEQLPEFQEHLDEAAKLMKVKID